MCMPKFLWLTETKQKIKCPLVFDKWIKSVNNKLSAYVYGSVSQFFLLFPILEAE